MYTPGDIWYLDGGDDRSLLDHGGSVVRSVCHLSGLLFGLPFDRSFDRSFTRSTAGRVVRVFLDRTETAECWWCQQAEQSVHHLHTKCRKWRRERRVLTKELRALGIGWQR